MRIEDAKWEPPLGRNPRLSLSALAVHMLKPGDVKRIPHDDVRCTILSSKADDKRQVRCSLAQIIGRLRRNHGWVIDYYHEHSNVLVVRRIA